MKPFSWIVGGVAVAFWGAMMLLLVQTNTRDGNAPFSELPASLVLRQMFKNEVTSELGIYDGQRRIGSVSISTTREPCQIAFDGNVSAGEAAGGRRPINFSLALDLDAKNLSPQTITLRLQRRLPALQALVEADLSRKVARYEINSGALHAAAKDVSLSAAALLATVPGLAGLPLPFPDATRSMGTPTLSANRASAVIRDERLDVFRLRAALGDLQATATMGQLGEIFIVRTSTAYSLLANGLDPARHLR